MTAKNVLTLIVYVIVLGVCFSFDILFFLMSLDVNAGGLRVVGVILFTPFTLFIIYTYHICVLGLFEKGYYDYSSSE